MKYLVLTDGCRFVFWTQFFVLTFSLRNPKNSLNHLSRLGKKSLRKAITISNNKKRVKVCKALIAGSENQVCWLKTFRGFGKTV